MGYANNAGVANRQLIVSRVGWGGAGAIKVMWVMLIYYSGFVFCFSEPCVWEMFAYNDDEIHKDFGVTR